LVPTFVSLSAKVKRPGEPGLFLFVFLWQRKLPPRLAPLAPAAASSAASASALRTRVGFIDVYGPTVELGAVEALDGFRSSILLHLNESKATRPACIPVGYYRGRRHLAALRKQVSELIFRCLIRQVSYK